MAQDNEPVQQRAEAPAVDHDSPTTNDSVCIHCTTRIFRSWSQGVWTHWVSGSMYCPVTPPSVPEGT